MKEILSVQYQEFNTGASGFKGALPGSMTDTMPGAMSGGRGRSVRLVFEKSGGASLYVTDPSTGGNALFWPVSAADAQPVLEYIRAEEILEKGAPDVPPPDMLTPFSVIIGFKDHAQENAGERSRENDTVQYINGGTELGNRLNDLANRMQRKEPGSPAGPQAFGQGTKTAAGAAAGWTCPGCGSTGNTGRFCFACGAPRP